MPEKAAAAVRSVLLEGWAGRKVLRYAPLEMPQLLIPQGACCVLVWVIPPATMLLHV